MGEPTSVPVLGEPDRWLLIFARKAASRWTSFIAFGARKHVAALGYIPGIKAWVLYDVQFGRTQIVVARGEEGLRQLIDLGGGTDVDMLWMRPLGPRRGIPLAFLCTTAIMHLIGLPGYVARPDALWRCCLRHGGEVVDGKA